MATTPPGWYDDGHGALRWWDGQQWTEHVAAPDPEIEGATAPTEADIVAAHEAGETGAGEPRTAEPALAAPAPAPAEVDPATALGLGVPPAAATPAYPPYATDQPQGAYPGGYPEDGSAGAFSAATEPRKSKLWILWVVLGVVMLGIVVAAAIVIPLLLLGAATGGSSGAPSGVTPSGADEEAAVAAVELYDDAWQDVDCDAYLASTSEDFRAGSGLADCTSFQDTASNFAASVQDYVVTVTDITSEGGQIVVGTTETYDAVLDDEGEPLDPPQPQEVEYEYTVIDVDGAWVIDVLED
jgi:hypothetical protein